MAGLRVFKKGTAHLAARHVGEIDVADDQVRPALSGRSEGLAALLADDGVEALGGESPPQDLERHLIVVDEQDEEAGTAFGDGHDTGVAVLHYTDVTRTLHGSDKASILPALTYHLEFAGKGEPLRARVWEPLSREGYALSSSRTGTECLRRLPERAPHLLILDLDLGDMAGLDFLRILRQTASGAKLPVLGIGSARNDEFVTAVFELGTDDLVAPACDPGEFLARVRAVLRRHFERGPRLEEPIAVGPIVLDFARHECRVRSREVLLRRREFDLLKVLMHKAGRVLTRAYLLETVWGPDTPSDPRTVDVVVSRLRAALGPKAGRWLETVDGYGYRLKDPSSSAR